MRQINADALIEKLEQIHSKDFGFEMAIIGAINEVKKAPTVEAIPMWFIKGCQDDHLIFITELINAWEERKEE